MTSAVKTVYGALWCDDCKRSKSFLDLNGIDYEWIDVDKDSSGNSKLLEINEGLRIIPTIVFEDGSILREPSDSDLAAKVGIG